MTAANNPRGSDVHPEVSDMAAPQQYSDIQWLIETVIGMGEAERRGDIEALGRVLDDGLRFRRASGQVVTKEEFLKDLQDPGNTFDCLESEVVDVTVYENQAIVVLIVRAKGTRGGKPFAGAFRNVRLFIRDPGETEAAWRCALWLNAKTGEDGC